MLPVLHAAPSVPVVSSMNQLIPAPRHRVRAVELHRLGWTDVEICEALSLSVESVTEFLENARAAGVDLTPCTEDELWVRAR